jgi:predicted permease
VSDAQARTELALVTDRSAVPERDRRTVAQVKPFGFIVISGLGGGLRATPEFLGFQSLALLVLLVACINVAMLVFARTATRSNELAVRTALGASRARIVIQIFVECLVLALLAAGAGLLLLGAALQLVWRLIPASWAAATPYWIRWDIGPDTVIHALALAGVSAVVAGVVPAIRFTGTQVQATIQRARARRTGVRFGGLSGVLLVVDVAVAVAAVGFALTAWDVSDRAAAAGDAVGIPADEYLAATVRLSSDVDQDASLVGSGRGVSRLAMAQEELVRRLREEPRVQGVAVANALPRMDHPNRLVEVEGMDAPEDRRGVSSRTARVAVDFFEALGQPILAGRGFGAGDLGDGSRVVIVNTTFIERALGGQNAVGRRIRFVPWGDGEPGPWKEIVGVVGHLGMRVVSPDNDQGVYEPLTPGQIETVRLGIHLGNDPSTFAPRLREVAGEVAPDMLVSATGPLGDVFEGDWYLLRAVILGVWLLVCVLLALAASGIYAIMSFSVAERTTEIGIRSALGASRREVIISVARRAMAQIAVGVLLGLPFAAVFLVNGDGSRYVDAGRTLVVGIVVMTVVGLAACTGPTLRALRIHPREAMNGDG